MYQTLQLEKFESTDFKYDNAFSKLLKAFLVPNLNFLHLYKTLKSEKFKGVDFKYDNSFFQILTCMCQIIVILVPNLIFFGFTWFFFYFDKF